MKKCFVFICFFFFNTLNIFSLDKIEVKLNKCIDGDTAKFYVNNKVETVRFLAINSPELGDSNHGDEPYSVEARDFTCEMLTNASLIELEFDPKSNKKDKYNRLLAWIYVDNELLQSKIIKEGLAEVKYIYDDYMYVDELRILETSAKGNNLGIWYSNTNNNFLPLSFSIIIIIFTFIYFLLTKFKK